ncbi:MAG TPA: helix-turn-helix transcriptional regulator [Acidimicrobiales bacterium]
MTTQAPALLVPPVRLGRLLREAREAKGESIGDLARRCGFAYDEGWFVDLESGRVPLDEPLVRWLSALYGITAGELVPARSQLVVDLDEGLLVVGGRSVPVFGHGPATGPAAVERVLTNYLALVYLLRDAPVGTPIPLREGDVDVLAHTLQRNRRDVQASLGRLMGAESTSVEQRSQLLRRRLVVPVAGILVGLTAVGGLLLVKATDSDSPAEERPATEAGPSVEAKDIPVEIGDPAVLERGGVQTTR